jgi:glyoxylase-like metal-dependent hydrolase (beta-lactamase superfamily II)
MNTENHRFKLGTFDCTIVSDGYFAYPHPAQVFFANAPEEALAGVLRGYGLDPEHWEEYVSPYSGLVINTGQNRVLVDTGADAMAPTTGKLMSSLQAEGIAAEDIDTVILTHAHPDHIGGDIDTEGKPAFPNARYVMWKDEWDFWTQEPDVSRLQVPDYIKEALLTFARENLPPIQGQLHLVDQEAEIVPGIRVAPAAGHTPGHVVVAISSGSEQMLYISDAALHPIHLRQPDWYAAVDLDPRQALASRRRIMDMAAAENALVYASHFPAPGLGHVAQKGEAWEWQPIETTGDL